MGIPDTLVQQLTLLNERLDESLILQAMQQHALPRREAQRFVQQQVRNEVHRALQRY